MNSFRGGLHGEISNLYLTYDLMKRIFVTLEDSWIDVRIAFLYIGLSSDVPKCRKIVHEGTLLLYSFHV